jgi:hypothetical protein
MLGNPKGRNVVGVQDMGGRIILKWLLNSVRVVTGFIWLRLGTSVGLL